ncbi:BMC domain-containing protein [Desulfobotulus sp. H1]|uniref:BMC domain-containing protein n=1 Tax=Desulfobotulus pelophilus TaxID=2823377 RepID=A0ABT3N7B5_9BACT|nr:BMC domain-containing protein [Desulfobotulus pelophilus]MCW7753355.1 BMC domain-containing protein [Desulfobotulus pelophilus]
MDTLGMVEAKSIAAGVELADGMMKAAAVELVRASTICSGRYLIFVAGDRDAVGTSIRFAEDSGRLLVGSFILSNVSPQVLAVLKRSQPAEEGAAIGVIESRNVSSGVAAADGAVKRSAVRLVRLVTGQGINGKSYFVMSGDVASVKEAAEAAEAILGRNLVEAVVIPKPSASVVKALTSVVR